MRFRLRLRPGLCDLEISAIVSECALDNMLTHGKVTARAPWLCRLNWNLKEPKTPVTNDTFVSLQGKRGCQTVCERLAYLNCH